MTPSRNHLGAISMRTAILCLVLAFFSSVAVWGGPLLYAAAKGDLDEMARLLAAGADPNEQWDRGAEHHGVTALDWAALHGRVDSIQFLTRLDIDTNIQNINDGGTPLHYAAWSGHPDVIVALLDTNADITVKNLGGPCPCGSGSTTSAPAWA